MQSYHYSPHRYLLFMHLVVTRQANKRRGFSSAPTQMYIPLSSFPVVLPGKRATLMTDDTEKDVEATFSQKRLLLLHPTPLCPIHELHSTINIVSKSHTYSESHCNRWDPLCQMRCFHQTFQSINDLITSI